MSDTVQYTVGVVGQEELDRLAKRIQSLEKDNRQYAKSLDDLNRASKEAAAANVKLNTSFSSIAATGQRAIAPLNELVIANTKSLEQTMKLVEANGIMEQGLKKRALASTDLASQISLLNSVMVKQSGLTAELTQLNNAAYVSELKKNAALAASVASRKEELFAYEKAMAGKAAAQASYNAQAMAGEAAAQRLLGIQVAGSAANKALAEQMRGATVEATKHAVATSKLTELQQALHQTARGLSGAMGSLWLTYGQPMAPMIAGFLAAATAMEAVKQGANFSYVTKMVETLDAAQGKAALSAGEIRKELLGLSGLRKGPQELAVGLQEFVKAGASASTALKDIAEMSRFATLGEMDMAAATKYVVTQANAFGESYTDVANKIAYAAAYSATSIEGMGIAMSHTAPLGATLGFKLSEVAAALAILSNKGVDASKAGTALTTTFLRLAQPTENAQKVMDQLNVSFSAFKPNGTIKTMGEQLRDLGQILSGLGKEDQLKLMAALSDLRSLKGLSILTDEVRTLGTGFEEMVEKVDKSAKGVTFLGDTFSKMGNETISLWEEMKAVFSQDLISAGNMEAIAWVLDKALMARRGFSMIGAALQDDQVKILELTLAQEEKRGATAAEKLAVLDKQASNLEARIAEAKKLSAEDAIPGEAENLQQQLNKVYKQRQPIILELDAIAMGTETVAKAAEKAGMTVDKFMSTMNPTTLTSYNKAMTLVAQEGLSEVDRALVKIKETHDLQSLPMLSAMKKGVSAGVNTQEEYDTLEKSLNQKLELELSAEKKKWDKKAEVADNGARIKAEKEEREAAKERKLSSDKLALEDRYNTILGASDDVKIARKIAGFEKAYNEDKFFIQESYKDEYEKEEMTQRAFEVFLTLKNNALEEQRIKEEDLREKKLKAEQEFYRDLADMEEKYGLSNKSPKEEFESGIDRDLERTLSQLKGKGLDPAKLREAEEAAKGLAQRIKGASLAAAELGNDPFVGFIAGAKAASKEVITLGKLGAEMGREMTSALSDVFKGVYEVFTTDAENPFTDKMSSISDKIKAMQYESLEGGLAQLEYLRKEYDTTLEGAMAGNEEAFDAYMSNLDTYLSKAKEEMSPEEYAKLYAQTMEDLKKLNTEYATHTETTWDRLGDVFDSFMDRMKSKFMDVLAEMIAKDFMNAIFNSGSGSTSSGIMSTALGWIVNGVMGSGSSTATQGGQYQGWEAGAASNTGNNWGLTNSSGGSGSSSSGSGVGGVVGGLATTAILNKIYSYAYTNTVKPLVDTAYNTVVEAASQYFSQTATAATNAAMAAESGAVSVAEAAASAAQATTQAAMAAEAGAVAVAEAGTAASQAAMSAAQTANQASAMAAEAGAVQVAEAGAGASSAAAAGSMAYAPMAYIALFGLMLTFKKRMTLSDSLNSTGYGMSGLADATGLDTSGKLQAVTEDFKALNTQLGQFDTVSVDTTANLMVLGQEVRTVDERGQEMTTGMNYVVETFNAATGTWENTRINFSDMIAEMEAIGPVTAEAIAAIAGQVAAEHNVAVLADELAQAYAEVQLGTEAFTQSIALVGGAFTDAAGNVISGLDMMSAAAAGFNMSGFQSADYSAEGHNFANIQTAVTTASTDASYDNEIGHASGGWIGKYGSGVINQGSGREDDVFLGMSGNAANYGMGGEFVVNKKSAKKHARELAFINRDFADGGSLNQFGVPYSNTSSFIADIRELSSSDAVTIMDKVLELIRFNGVDDYARSLTELTEDYEDQIKKVAELGGTEEDLGLIRQAQAIETAKIVDDAAKEMRESIAALVEPSKYNLYVAGFSDTKKSLYDTYQEMFFGTMVELRALGATYEELMIVGEDFWRKIKEIKQQALDEALEVSTTALEAAFGREKESVSKRYSDTLKGLNDQLSEANKKVGELESIVSSLKGAMDSLKGTETLKEGTFRASFRDLERRALARDISEGLSDTLSEITKISTDYYGSSYDYQLDLMKSMNYIDVLDETAKSQLTEAEASVKGLEDLIQVTQSNMDAELAALDAQLNALLGIDTSIQSLADAIAQFNASKSAAAAGKGGGGGGSVGGVFNSSDYIQAKAMDLVNSGVASNVEEAANMFLQALNRDNVSLQQHFERYGKVEGLYSGSSPNATVEAATYGSPGSFSTADYVQAKATSLFNSGLANDVESAKAAFLGALAETGGTPEQHYSQFGASEGVYKFATGGSFSMRGPAGSDNLSMENVRVTAGEVVNVTQGDVMMELKNEIAALKSVLAAVVTNTAVTAKQLSRWDGDGMPDIRVV